MEDNERRMYSDFVADDDESMSESEGAEPPQAVYMRQQIFGAERLKRPTSAVPSRPTSVVPSSAVRRSPPQHEPSAEEEAMADEAQQFAEDTHAANAVQGVVEPPPDHIPVQDFIDNGTFDELPELASQDFEAMLDPPTYDGHD